MTLTDIPALNLIGITKRFGGALALDGADLSVRRGTVHGLVGQNGAGKSTLIKVLAGIHSIDGGAIEIDGIRQGALTPAQVDRLGIRFIHQDRLLVPGFTVGEALLLGREPRLGKSPLLDRRALARQADDYLQSWFGLSLPHDRLISELTTAEKQIIQITRALLDNPRVLVFDEPTAALVRAEVDTLFTVIRRLRDEGVTILYISHYLSEITDLCDTVTVLRNGRVAATLPVSETSADDIARRMVARELDQLYPQRQPKPGPALLQARNLSRSGSYQSIDLTLHQGEILGITGLLGSGAKELIRTFFGLERPERGSLEIRGRAEPRLTPAGAVARGIAFVPEDRRRQGVALDLTLRENTTLPSLKRFTGWGGILNTAGERSRTAELISQLQIKASGTEALVRSLSGGNQQKVALAKWLCRQSEIYLLDEPSVGVDIAAKVEIYQMIADLAARGAGVLILSSDLGELLGLCDRIHVLYRGRITATLTPAQTSEDELLALATGSRQELAHAL